MPLYPKDFIATTLLQEYKEIIYTHRFYYIGFALVCVGVEFLGKCIGPEQDWHARGLSQVHFRNAIAKLMPRYSKHAKLLYSSLRSGLAHGLLPGPEIGLTHRAESAEYQTAHLGRHRGALVIVIEDFYDDFAVACQQIIARTFPPGDKMNKALLRVPSDTAVSPMFLGSMPIAKTTPY